MMRKSLLIYLTIVLLTSFFYTFLISKEKVIASSDSLYPAYSLENGKEIWGYIDENGIFIIKPQFSQEQDFNEDGLAIVYLNDNQGVIDKSGKKVLDFKYTNIFQVDKGVYFAQDGKNSFLVNKNGGVIATLNNNITIYSFSEGMALISKNIGTQYYYGYMDTKGKIVIQPIYKDARDFKNGKAIVEDRLGKYAIIDKTGKTIANIAYNDIFGISDNTFIFNENQKYGYCDLNGKVILKPLYTYANPFVNGLAVVNAGDFSESKNGLINKKGEFIIKPQYLNISSVGANLYAVSKESDLGYSDMYAKKALFDGNGKQLTDFKFYQIENYNGDYACANNGTYTYFIDKKGIEVKSLPEIKGNGTLEVKDNLIKANIDNKLSYLNKDGKTIWCFDNTFVMKNGASVKEVKYSPDKFTTIYYPQISNNPKKSAQYLINNKLKALFGITTSNNEINQEDNSPAEVTGEYTASSFGDLLVINQTGYYYPIGAAHGMPSKEYYYINLDNGNFYKIKDLFKKGSDYSDRLTRLIREQIIFKSKQGDSMFFPGALFKIGEDTNFIFNKDSLTIYFDPYEIAAYAAGFPKFEIPYDQVSELIDTNGELWKAIKSQIQLKTNDTETIKENQIKDTVESYERNMIDAINNNKFSVVESSLVKNSSLYNSQIKLVDSLNKQKISETLVEYDVKDIKLNNDKQTYSAYVTEKITIYYSPDRNETRDFNWIYTVNYTSDKNIYQLSNIQKWVQ